MINVALDTVIVAALLDDKDKWHQQSLAIRNALQVAEIQYVIFDCVINETISVLTRRLYEQRRAYQVQEMLDAITRLAPENEITWISSETRRLYSDIFAMVKESEGALNFHDALIALVCREFVVRYPG